VIFNNENHKLNLYGTNVEVDYRGYEVTVQNFIRVITGLSFISFLPLSFSSSSSRSTIEIKGKEAWSEVVAVNRETRREGASVQEVVEWRQE
jgi:hypothetical protein